LANALRTALLLLPKEFTEEELYLTIAGLSYRGDFRKYIGENPNKVQNIVSLQFDNFRLLYGELIRAFPNIELSGHHVLTVHMYNQATLLMNFLMKYNIFLHHIYIL